ncbi:hypothetical protein [Devosia sp.]|uniref:hypothetical protein n=1 Tax=Devosia sp. TaxID=1871048 RepID=UPI001B258315|nr:hypothetical protein [Devosia sp.]MBO9589347.1 hypothetical protein [Devosia sp.]
MVATAAVIFSAIVIGLALFQANLAAGAPWGRLAWGGQFQRLPLGLRIGSAVSILIYVGFAAVLLGRAGLVALSGEWLGPATWVIAGVLVLGTVMNAISRSMSERLVMTPVAAVLCGAAVIVALGQ